MIKAIRTEITSKYDQSKKSWNVVMCVHHYIHSGSTPNEKKKGCPLGKCIPPYLPTCEGGGSLTYVFS
jgi:hypothetical protein